jgi:predicted nucleic acid-binding protein
MNGRKILVDTSIWIDYLKNKSSRIAWKVDGMLNLHAGFFTLKKSRNILTLL